MSCFPKVIQTKKSNIKSALNLLNKFIGKHKFMNYEMFYVCAKMKKKNEF